jgi:hypothetical protein
LNSQVIYKRRTPLRLEKPAGWEKGDCRQDEEGEKNEVRERAERKPRRSRQQVEREKRDDNSLFPFLSGAAQEIREHGQRRDSRIGYPTSSGGGILVLIRSRSLHVISHQPRQTVMI